MRYMGYHPEQEFYSFELRRDFNKLKLLPQVADDCPASRGPVVAECLILMTLLALQPIEHYSVLVK